MASVLRKDWSIIRVLACHSHCGGISRRRTKSCGGLIHHRVNSSLAPSKLDEDWLQGSTHQDSNPTQMMFWYQMHPIASSPCFLVFLFLNFFAKPRSLSASQWTGSLEGGKVKAIVMPKEEIASVFVLLEPLSWFLCLTGRTTIQRSKYDALYQLWLH